MAPVISLGTQSYEFLIENKCFFIDKTDLIREWWENQDAVTLVARPRRFGKTLNLNMLECFFSNRYAGRGDLFEEFSIWENPKYRSLQGDILRDEEKSYIHSLEKYVMDASASKTIPDDLVINSLYELSLYLNRYFGKKVLILLDEYDTPLQEAYVKGFWDELAPLIRGLFNATFKTNPFMERSFMTGITRISRESIFSDLNNLTVVTTTSEMYRTQFGFTEDEVFHALDQFDMSSEKGNVKAWYDGFTCGYLRVAEKNFDPESGLFTYVLALTNKEVSIMFHSMIRDWFSDDRLPYRSFLQALLTDDVEYMNEYMNEVAKLTFSFFDTGSKPSGDADPERFYHGFVLGLLVELAGQYRVLSKRESGFGRYDVMLEPTDHHKKAYVLEFKVRNPRREASLEDTLCAALGQIEEKAYDTELISKGIPKEQIRHYGFAFEGKKVLIG